MLCITLLPGGYFTVDDRIVVQFDRLTGERAHLMVDAPREMPILRGEVLERNGGQRPACVVDPSPRYVRQLSWNHKKKQALAELRQTLDRMGDGEEVQSLREKLEIIFPQAPEAVSAASG